MNIFLEDQDYTAPIKRNPYDLQRLVNGTYRSGIIYPIGWDEVGFGDSIRLDINAGLRTLPMAWPIQTPLIAKFYTFYVRFRTLMKSFTDFRFGNKQIVHPYISLPSDNTLWSTGQLADYMGIPTTFASSHTMLPFTLVYPHGEDWPTPHSVPLFYVKSQSLGDMMSENISYEKDETYVYGARLFAQNINSKSAVSPVVIYKDFVAASPQLVLAVYEKVSVLGIENYKLVAYQFFTSLTLSDNYYTLDISSGTYYDGGGTHSGGLKTFFSSLPDGYKISEKDYFYMIHDYSAESPSLEEINVPQSDIKKYVFYDMGDGITELKDVSNPFAGSHPEIPLSALPFRAYEACYRSHFQDLINEPFIIDGEPQYNRYITNDGDGPDDTQYELKHRNWEADRFTSCKPSPQQGLAPIVGVTSSGDIVLQRADGTDINYSLTFDKYGNLDGWNERVAGQANGDITVKRRLLDLATTGFTINSLRDVNSYQHWKEAVYRRSPKFRDQVHSVFGVNLEYKELDMPEFLGGFDVMLNVQEITQTSSSVENAPLGDLAGRGALVGRSKHSISHYCDEEGIVISVMCITPIPVYSQMLDRKWIKSNPLDYYNPQFGKIGNQAVTYEEVCPVQAYNEGVDVHDVFGYQRPWYHYISSYDEVHGLFRNSMNGFVMQRIFGSTPELGKDFLHIDESQMNEVFIAGQGQDDTFYGQINYDCKIKRGIPRKHVAALE